MSNGSASVEKALGLKKWAIVGASDKPDRYSYKILVLMLERGYDLYPIHPKLKEIEGVACYASLADLPAKPDVVCFVVNPEIGLGVMEETANADIHWAWLQPGARGSALNELARESGIEVVERCVLVELGARPDLSFV